MNPYRIGDPISLRFGDRVLSGRVAALGAQHVELSFPLGPWQGASNGVLSWPDGAAQAIELASLAPTNELTLKVPLADLPRAVRVPAAPVPEPVSPLAAGHVEMRRSVRVPADFSCYVVDPLADQLEVPAQAQDVSSGGIRLTCEQLLSLGREYVLRLPLGETTLEVRARILRRLGPNVYALKFLDRDVGHRVMSALFARVRGEQGLRPRVKNFRRT